MTMLQDYIGVDVAKNWIDIHHLSTGAARRISISATELRTFASRVGTAVVVFEASGGYERPLIDALVAAGARYARVNPHQAREFARASGRLARSDRVEARVLAETGRALNPAPTEPLAPARDKLAALVARRTDLTDMIGRETNIRKQAHDPFVAQQIDAVVRVLSRHLKNIEAEIARQIESDETSARQSSCLRSMPGVGPVVAAHLLAGLPELGRLDRRAIASLAGLAPLAKDSGLTRGKRSIWGGRAPLRRAIYLGAFIASRHDATVRTFRHRLQSAGKPVKVAITACARKLLTILNAMLREGADYRRPAA